MSRWDKLSMQDKSDLIKLYVANGIFNLEEIKKDYNKFDGGGKKEAIVDLRGVRDDNSDLDGEEDTFEYKPPKVTDLVLKAANAVLSSKFVPKDKKERLLELAMRMTGGNADIETVNVISKYLKSKDGINTIKQTLLTNTPIKDIISKSNAPDNYTGFAFSNDFLDSDVVSFIEEHPNDKDFVEAYTTGGIPFESAGVFKINDRDSTRLGRYKNYLDTNYKDRYVPTYQGHIDTVSMDIVKDLNRKSYNKETHTIGLDSDYDLPFEFGDKKGTPGYYDAAGYNLEVVKGKDGKLYGRKSDVYDFLPEDFIKRWMEGGSHTHNIVKTLDKLGNPFIFRSPWFGVNNKTVPRGLLYDYYNSNKFESGGPLKDDSYNIFEDENSFASRDAHRASLTEFVEANPKLYGINTADFVDFFSELSGLEGSYNHEAGKGMTYSGYYGLKGGRDYSREDQHKRAFKHLSELFKNNIVKEDLKKGAERGYTQAQILAKYWNQGNRVTNYLYNNVDDNDGVGTKISDYGWNMKSNIDYSNYLKDAITDDFVLVKNVNTLSDAIKRSRNKGTNFSNREKYILDLNTEVKKHLKKDKEAKFDPLKLRVGDTIWLNRPKYLNK